eukprot:09847.XXX_207692_207805_1 [CDS] Oithona nana genome sequencing.
MSQFFDRHSVRNYSSFSCLFINAIYRLFLSPHQQWTYF